MAYKKTIGKMFEEKQRNIQAIVDRKEIAICAGLSMNKSIDIAISEGKITETNIERWRNWIFRSQEKFMKEIIAEKEKQTVDPFSDSEEAGMREIETERQSENEAKVEADLEI